MDEATIRLATGRRTTPASPSFSRSTVEFVPAPDVRRFRVGRGDPRPCDGEPGAACSGSLDLLAGPVPVGPSSMKLWDMQKAAPADVVQLERPGVRVRFRHLHGRLQRSRQPLTLGLDRGHESFDPAEPGSIQRTTRAAARVPIGGVHAHRSGFLVSSSKSSWVDRREEGYEAWARTT